MDNAFLVDLDGGSDQDIATTEMNKFFILLLYFR